MRLTPLFLILSLACNNAISPDAALAKANHAVLETGRTATYDDEDPAESDNMPDLELPPDTLVLREHIANRGAERTGNWWARFDGRGCYAQEHNTWLWVHDPLLQRSTSRPLHFNTLPPGAPWFCLTDRQLARLIGAARQVLSAPAWSAATPAGPVDRWTVAVGGRSASVVVPVGGDPGPISPVIDIIEDLSREGVWGQSPENDAAAWAAATEPALPAVP